MKNCATIFFFLLLGFFSQAQNYLNKVFVQPNVNGATSIEELDSNFYMIGQEVSTTYRIIKCYKLDSVGDTIWVKTYSDGDKIFYPQKILSLNNNLYVFGAFYDSTNTENSDLFLASFNLDFEFNWMKRYGGDYFDNGRDLILNEDSTLVLTGTKSPSADNLEDFYLVKTDSLGNVIWDRTYGTTNSDVCNVANKTSDGGYILSGTTWILPTQDVFGNTEMMVVKVDSLGNQQWLKTFGTDFNDAGGEVEELYDQSFIVTTGFGINSAQIRPILMKLDQNGEIIWRINYNEPVYSIFEGLIEKNDGTLVVNGVTHNSNDHQIAWILKFDPLGNMIWERRIEYPYNDIFQYDYELKETSNGGYIFCGMAVDSSSVQRAWLVKTDCFACDSLLCYYPDSVCLEYDCSLYPVNANFTIDDAIINLANAGEDTITFESPFGNTTNRVWDFGDGTVSYTDSLVQHEYEAQGTYEVQLIVYHGMCSDTLTQTVQVVNIAGLDEELASSLEGGLRRVTIYPNPNKGSFVV
ncbi:MAG: PKD domain-containing protein, partial [Bacteroidota bacterium]